MARDIGRTGHNLRHQMIGKTDHAGRLFTEAEKRAIKEAKMHQFPNSDWWNQQAHPLDDELIDYIGKPAFDEFIDTFPDDVLAMDLFYAIRQKLADEKDNFTKNPVDFPYFWLAKAEEKLQVNEIVATRVLRLCKINPYVDGLDDLLSWLGDFIKAFDDGTPTIQAADLANKKIERGKE